MKVQLRRLNSTSCTKILTPPPNGTVKIWLAGRGTSCQIYTKSKYASRKHFSITYRDENYYLTDLQSANGTFLNNDKINSEERLNYGNTISVGVPPNFDVPDAIVYVFEECKEANTTKDETDESDIFVINEIKSDNVSKLKCNETETKDANLEPCFNDSIEIEYENIKAVENTHLPIQNIKDDKSVESIYLDKMEKHKSISMCEKSIENSIEIEDVDKTADIPLADTNTAKQNHKRPYDDITVHESKPPKIMKLSEDNVPDVEIKSSSPKQVAEPEEDDIECSILAYNASTQVDDVEVKSEPDLLNYSQAEELIEIDDSENEDWMLENIKNEVVDVEEEEDDNDVMFIEQIIRNKDSTGFLPVVSTSDKDLTETDRKWVGKLFKIKQEKDFSQEEVMSVDATETDSSGKINEEHIAPEEYVQPTDASGKQLENDIHVTIPQDVQENFVPEEKQKATDKRKGSKKSVSFDLVPKIRYFEVPPKLRFTTEEKGNMYFSRILYNICNWNTVWLEECKRVASDKDPPDLCDIPFRKIPKKFTSHTDYMSSFTPVMLLHLWNKVKNNWKQSGSSAFKQTVSLDSCNDYQAENLCVCECTGVVQSVDAHKQLLRNGHLVILYLSTVRDLKETPGAKKYSKNSNYLVFGFLRSKVYERYQNQPLHKSLAERCSSNRGDLHLVKLTIIIKKRPNLKIDNEKLIQITAVHHISSDIKMFTGICFLPRSPLCKAILKPNKVEFTLASPPEKNEFVFKGPLDNHQREIVSKLSYTCSSTDSFLYSIHGAAGTGKGQVIVAFILELLYGNDWKNLQRPKIIYCTSSVSPLDEMISRLKTCRDAIVAPSKFSIVRAGPGKDFSLTTLAQSFLYSDKGLKEKNKTDVEAKILGESDVICTTCSLTGLSSMIWAFEKRLNLKKNQKIICILDEAMSCKESDSMLPLFLGVTHFILVGDLYLSEPPFSGEKTHCLGLDMSLFSRLYKNYANIPKDLWPAYFLKTQFRMQPTLSKFASTFIYNQKLRESTTTSKNKINQLPSYTVIVDQTPEDLSDSEKHQGRVVFELVKAIVKNTNTRPIRIFIPTCEQKQVEVIQTFLKKGKYPEVEINQIVKFQGREADVVLFPYNGNGIMRSHLALPLTRAKSTLIVLMSQKSLNNNVWCQSLSKAADERKALRYINAETTSEGFESLLTVQKNVRRKSIPR